MKKILIVSAALMMSSSVFAQVQVQPISAQVSSPFIFTDVKINPVTSVKDQASSGTCWSYAGLGFIESELIRKGKGEHDLSEMWIVRYTYLNKAIKYARMHGTVNLSGGGATHDNFDIIDEYGIVPQEVYQGLNYGLDKNNHGELDAVIKAYMDAVIKQKTLSTAWISGLNGILDSYLGKAPEKFKYKGKEYTPKSFAAELGIKKEDYISLASFTYKPYNTWMAIEVPDNFAWGLSYNVTLDGMMKTIDNAIEKGMTVMWASDVSEKGFQYNKGFAILPILDVAFMNDSEKARWTALTAAERASQMTNLDSNSAEIKVTPELRQKWFDNYETTDDHGMQIVGIAKDQNGKKFYKVKNSWNTTNPYQGYFYASEEFVKGKTMNIVVPKEAMAVAFK